MPVMPLACPPLLIGRTSISAVRTDAEGFDLDVRFRMVREAGAIDDIERSPPSHEVDARPRAVDCYGACCCFNTPPAAGPTP